MIEFAAICLAANIYFEARNQSEMGQIAVAQVTMNRAGHDVSKVCEVTLKRKQFSWLNGKTKKKEKVILAAFEEPKDKKAWARSKRIANQVLSKKHEDIVDGSTHYHAKYVNPKWNKDKQLKKVTTIGDHIFYKPVNKSSVSYVKVAKVEVEKVVDEVKNVGLSPDFSVSKMSLKLSEVKGFGKYLLLLTCIAMVPTTKRRK